MLQKRKDSIKMHKTNKNIPETQGETKKHDSMERLIITLTDKKKSQTVKSLNNDIGKENQIAVN